jgi:NAD(P)-dependent dehydrogenase (short-subunit alcohol dehydrogenase family)
VADWGTIGILVNNAGIAIPKGILEAELDYWNKVLAPTTANTPNPTTPPSSRPSVFNSRRFREHDGGSCMAPSWLMASAFNGSQESCPEPSG